MIDAWRTFCKGGIENKEERIVCFLFSFHLFFRFHSVLSYSFSPHLHWSNVRRMLSLFMASEKISRKRSSRRMVIVNVIFDSFLRSLTFCTRFFAVPFHFLVYPLISLFSDVLISHSLSLRLRDSISSHSPSKTILSSFSH